MRDTEAILGAVARLEQVQADLAAISSRDDDRRRHDLIELRRSLSLHIAEVGRIADPHFADTAPEIAQTYRSRFSAMRSAAAMHQAEWPAVRLDQADASYRASALAVRDANRAFVAWIRDALRSPPL
jgi:hypothetical protein